MSAMSYTNDDVEAGVLEIVKSQVKGSEAVTPQTELASAGVDSLAMVRILVAIEAKYGVWLEGDDLGPDFLKTVSSMAQAVKHMQANPGGSPI